MRHIVETVVAYSVGERDRAKERNLDLSRRKFVVAKDMDGQNVERDVKRAPGAGIAVVCHFGSWNGFAPKNNGWSRMATQEMVKEEISNPKVSIIPYFF